MKLFSRTPSPVSLEPVSRTSSSDAPPSPSAQCAAAATTVSSLDTEDARIAGLHDDLARASPPASCPPRRPRLRNDAPPFYQCWATVKQPGEYRRAVLRFCTVSGPTLRLSATPSADVLATSLCVFGATITTDEFPSWRIVIKTPALPSATRVQLFADSRVDHVMLTNHLLTAAHRSITDHYTFVSHSRDTLFSRVCNALDDHGNAVCVKLWTKQRLTTQSAALARREPVLLLDMAKHETIPDVCDIYDSPRAYYVVINGLCQNTLLSNFYQFGAFAEVDVALVIANLLNALTHIQQYNVVHRFIAPNTVTITTAQRDSMARIQRVQLSDFELANRVGDAQDSGIIPCVTDVLKQYPHVLRSHAAYVPPEVYINASAKATRTTARSNAKEHAGRRSTGDINSNAAVSASSPQSDDDGEQNAQLAFAHDVWSVGMVMHWMLVGCTPFDAHLSCYDKAAALIADASGMPVFSGPLWRGVSTGAKHLCSNLLHADPRYRLSPQRALQHPWLRL